MNITTLQIRALREKTGAGIMECKRALERSSGHPEKAAALLKELGLVQAKKRADREVNEGRVFVRTTAEKSVIVKIACETDFVARNEDFIRLGEACLDAALAAHGADPEPALAGLIADTALKIRENIVLQGVKTLTAGPRELLYGYVHGEGRIGVTVRVETDGPGRYAGPEIQSLVSDLALQAAACAPLFLSRADIDPGFLAAKKEEFTTDVRALGKKESLLDGIVRGKLEKLQTKICFLEQPFIRDEGRSVGEVMASVGKAAGLAVALTGFLYEKVGPASA